MSVSADDFRAAMSRFATGVMILTARDDHGADHGMTVNAFASVSLAPPLVLACIANDADMHPVLRNAPSFALNVLTVEQETLSRRFAADIGIAKRFDGVAFTRSRSGVILLDGALAHIECRRVTWHETGDHGICIGEVERTVLGVGEPLLYYRGDYARLRT